MVLHITDVLLKPSRMLIETLGAKLLGIASYLQVFSCILNRFLKFRYSLYAGLRVAVTILQALLHQSLGLMDRRGLLALVPMHGAPNWRSGLTSAQRPRLLAYQSGILILPETTTTVLRRKRALSQVDKRGRAA